MSACYLFSSLYARSLFYNLLHRLLRRTFALQMYDNACDIYIVRRSAHLCKLAYDAYIVRRSAHLCKLAYDAYIVRRSAHPRGSFLCNRNKVSYLHKNRGHAMHDLPAISLFPIIAVLPSAADKFYHIARCLSADTVYRVSEARHRFRFLYTWGSRERSVCHYNLHCQNN